MVGATGYAGFELARLLLRHPRLKTPLLLSREAASDSAATLNDLYPHISGNGSYPLEPFSWELLQRKGVDVLFLATPHEVSRAWVPEAESRGVRVVDLSGAWRLHQASHRAVYGFEDADAHAADRLTQKSVYGLPELHRDAVRGPRSLPIPAATRPQ